MIEEIKNSEETKEKQENITELNITEEFNEEEKKTIKYRYIKELANVKFQMEETREQNLIKQSSQMQTSFSFITAAILMATPMCIEHIPQLSKVYFCTCILIVMTFLLASLISASFAQWRYKTVFLVNVEDIREFILNSKDLEKLYHQYNQDKQFVDLLAKTEKNKCVLNDKRAICIRHSMRFFYLAVLSIVLCVIVGLCKFNA